MPAGAQNGASEHKALQITIFRAVSKAVIRRKADRGFKSLPLRSHWEPHGYAVSGHRTSPEQATAVVSSGDATERSVARLMNECVGYLDPRNGNPFRRHMVRLGAVN